MSNVIQFRGRKVDRVIIEEGWLTDSPDQTELGQHMYFVQVAVEGADEDDGVWFGKTYEEALAVAKQLAAEHGARIIDKVTE
jgi:hypothetical protein